MVFYYVVTFLKLSAIFFIKGSVRFSFNWSFFVEKIRNDSWRKTRDF